MVTSFEILDWVYQILNSASIGNNGGLYKLVRPTNSSKEDIIINSLPTSGISVKTGIININIYVPDINVMINNISSSQPNTSRLKTLTNKVIQAIEDIVTEDTHFFIESDNVFSENNFHFMNLRVRFNSHK